MFLVECSLSSGPVGACNVGMIHGFSNTPKHPGVVNIAHHKDSLESGLFRRPTIGLPEAAPANRAEGPVPLRCGQKRWASSPANQIYADSKNPCKCTLAGAFVGRAQARGVISPLGAAGRRRRQKLTSVPLQAPPRAWPASRDPTLREQVCAPPFSVSALTNPHQHTFLINPAVCSENRCAHRPSRRLHDGSRS